MTKRMTTRWCSWLLSGAVLLTATLVGATPAGIRPLVVVGESTALGVIELLGDGIGSPLDAAAVACGGFRRTLVGVGPFSRECLRFPATADPWVETPEGTPMSNAPDLVIPSSVETTRRHPDGRALRQADIAGTQTLFATDGAGTPRLIALTGRSGNQVQLGYPAGVPIGASFSGFTSSLDFSKTGRVAFQASLEVGFGGVTTNDDQGIWASTDDGGLRLVAREGDVSPLGSSFLYGTLSAVAGSDAGVVFRTGRKGGGNRLVCFSPADGGATEAVVAQVSDVPGELPELSSIAGPLRINSRGDLAFTGVARGTGSTIFVRRRGAAIEPVVQVADEVPGTGGYTVERVEPFALLNEAGDVLFVARLRAPDLPPRYPREPWSSARFLVRRRDGQFVVPSGPTGEVVVENPALLPPTNPDIIEPWQYDLPLGATQSRVTMGLNDRGEIVFASPIQQGSVAATRRNGLFFADAEGRVWILAITGEPFDWRGQQFTMSSAQFLENSRGTDDNVIQVAVDEVSRVTFRARLNKPGLAGDDALFLVVDPRAVGPSRCGDGIVQSWEVCDDANRAGSDGCDPDCRLEAGTTVTTLPGGPTTTTTIPVPPDLLSGDGKGKGSVDCLIGLAGYSAADLAPESRRPTVPCTDCDPRCDKDGVAAPNGACTFVVSACVNRPDGGTCTPRPLKSVRARGTSKGVKIDLSEGLARDGSFSCSPPTNFRVALRGRDASRRGKGLVTLLARKPRDADTFTFVCERRPEGEACPGS